jgi:hypothetical protein
VRKPGRAVRGSPASHTATCEGANATGIGWCQRVAGRKPHSRARSDSSFGCARASTSVAEVGERGPRFREARSRWQTGVWTGTRLPASSERTLRKLPRHRRPAPRRPSRGAGRGPSRAFERTSRGRGFRAMEGTSGRFPGRLVHASRQGAASAALEMIRERANDHGFARVATGVSEARYARITTGRQRPSR